MLLRYFKELLKDKDLMKKCIFLAIPIMLQTLVVSSVNLIDNLMVGQLGDIALSAVVSANKYYGIANFGINALIASCVIYISQFNGANNYPKMKESYRFALVSSYVILIIVSLLVFLFPKPLIAFIINDPEIIETGAIYLRLSAFSYLPLGISLCVSGGMRVVGDSKTPMFISIIAILINALLDYGLILGKFSLPQLGVAGAAIATIIARVIEAGIYIYVVNKGDYVFNTSLKDLFSFDKKLAKEIIIKAIPLLTNEVLWSFGMTMLLKAYSYRGHFVNTGYSIATTVAEVFFILFSGMAVSSTVLIGTPLGANELDKAKDNGYKLICFSEILSIIFGALMYLSKYLLPLVYPNVSSDSLQIAQKFLSIMGLFYWIYMFNTQCYFTLRAGGDTKSTMFMDSGFMWAINIPVILLLSYKTTLPIYMVYIIGQATDFIKCFVSYWTVKKEKWVINLAIKNN